MPVCIDKYKSSYETKHNTHYITSRIHVKITPDNMSRIHIKITPDNMPGVRYFKKIFFKYLLCEYIIRKWKGHHYIRTMNQATHAITSQINNYDFSRHHLIKNLGQISARPEDRDVQQRFRILPNNTFSKQHIKISSSNTSGYLQATYQERERKRYSVKYQLSPKKGM